MKTMSNRRGFSLLEMVIVLGIIAIVTHLAVRESSKYRNMNRSKDANRMLDDIQTAIAGPGHDFSGGFYADMGRLPKAVRRDPSDPASPLTLSELWRKPDDAAEYTEHVTDGVRVSCGWRGPYLRLPAGAASLRDPWGNPMESPDEAGGNRLRKADGTPVTAPGDEIAAVMHFGSDGIADTLAKPEGREQTDAAFTNSPAPATLTVTVIAENAAGNQETGNPVTIDVFEISADQSVTVKTATDTDGVLEFTGLKPGPHLLRIKYNGKEWPPRTLNLRSGHNTEEAGISVPAVSGE